MPARAHLLAALKRLYADMAEVRLEAEEEGDGWAGLTAEMVGQSVRDTADRAEAERRVREEG